MKRIDLLVRGLMAVLVAAFVMRPVVVSLHNGSIFPGARSDSKCLSDPSPTGQLATAKTNFHTIAKEFKDFTTQVSWFTREMVSAAGNHLLKPAATFCRTFPQGFYILRI